MRCCRRACRCCSYDEINTDELNKLKREHSNLTLLDVRSPQEYDEGHLPGSVLIPSYDIKKRVMNVLPDKNAYIVVYCQNGGRSRKVVPTLRQMGYKNVFNLKDGMEG